MRDVDVEKTIFYFGKCKNISGIGNHKYFQRENTLKECTYTLNKQITKYLTTVPIFNISLCQDKLKYILYNLLLKLNNLK